MKNPPWINEETDGGYTESPSFAMRPRIDVGGDIPQAVIAVRLDYRDKTTGTELSQRFYYVWDGSKDGFFQSSFHALPQAHTDRFANYLRKQLGEWEL